MLHDSGKLPRNHFVSTTKPLMTPGQPEAHHAPVGAGLAAAA